MKIGIITAMPEEFRAVAGGLGVALSEQCGALKGNRYSFSGHEILLVASGMGFDNAARTAESLIRDERPDMLVSTGFCGGVGSELRVGDVVVAKNIVIAVDGGYEEIPLLLSPCGKSFMAREALGGWRTVEGVFVSTPAIMSKKKLRAMLPGGGSNSVAEMESGAIAIIAAEHHISLLAIRVVSDSAEMELGFSLDELCDSGLRRVLPRKVLLSILRKPRLIPQLVQLAFDSRKAAKSLTALSSRLFSSL